MKRSAANAFLGQHQSGRQPVTRPRRGSGGSSGSAGGPPTTNHGMAEFRHWRSERYAMGKRSTQDAATAARSVRENG
eukprot:11195825-Lingulodinium_polyedra.AAC.1